MPDQVNLKINGVAFSGWESLTITRTIDSLADAFSLSGPFFPDNPDVVLAFKPFGYQSAIVDIDGETILTGQIEQVNPSLTADDMTLNVQGRSKTGFLVDCSLEGIGYQFDGLTLSKIAAKVAGKFGLSVTATKNTGPIKEARAEPGQGAGEFLSKLAQDSGLILSCDVRGNLVIDAPNPSAAPVAALVQGQGRLKGASAGYNGAGRFSTYTVLQQQDGAEGLSGKAVDSSIPVYRPIIQTGGSSDAGNVTAAAEILRAVSLAGAVSLSAELSGWRTDAGKLWAPGQIVTVKAPAVFVSRETAYMIAEVSYKLDGGGHSTSLRLVLPATYSRQMPGVFPWG